MLEAPTILASLAIGRPLAFLLVMILLAGPVAAGETSGSVRGDDPMAHPAPRPATAGDRGERPEACEPHPPRTGDSSGRTGAAAPERRSGRLLAALAEARAVAGGDTPPPEPPRETDPGKRKNFFRTRTGAVILIVASAVIVGSAARNSLLGDR